MKTTRLLLASLIALSAGSSVHATVIVIDANTVNIAPTGRLNIQINALIVRTSPFAQIYGYVVTGYNDGAWDGFGIRSSTATGDPLQITAVGCISNEEAGYADFLGHPTPTGLETFVRGTYYGDTNLDGEIDAADYARITPGGTDWYHGDFNYDGLVNAADTALIDRTVIAFGGIPAPEPASASLLGLGTLLLTARRRRGV